MRAPVQPCEPQCNHAGRISGNVASGAREIATSACDTNSSWLNCLKLFLRHADYFPGLICRSNRFLIRMERPRTGYCSAGSCALRVNQAQDHAVVLDHSLTAILINFHVN